MAWDFSCMPTSILKFLICVSGINNFDISIEDVINYSINQLTVWKTPFLLHFLCCRIRFYPFLGSLKNRRKEIFRQRENCNWIKSWVIKSRWLSKATTHFVIYVISGECFSEQHILWYTLFQGSVFQKCINDKTWRCAWLMKQHFF